jgi:hypothetical protein
MDRTEKSIFEQFEFWNSAPRPHAIAQRGDQSPRLRVTALAASSPLLTEHSPRKRTLTRASL